jgi:RNA-directed DNA polymerase
MSREVHVRFCESRGVQFPSATHLAVFCTSKEEAETVKARLADWLRPRGLRFNEEKTRILHLSEGFDFLGFNIRRHGESLIITPSKEAVKRVRNRLRSETQTLLGQNIAVVLRRLAPIVRGWSAYYRTVVSSRTFAALDSYVWRLTYKWAKPHPPEEVEALDRQPVLRQAQPVQEQQLGLW